MRLRSSFMPGGAFAAHSTVLVVTVCSSWPNIGTHSHNHTPSHSVCPRTIKRPPVTTHAPLCDSVGGCHKDCRRCRTRRQTKRKNGGGQRGVSRLIERSRAQLC